MDRKKNITSVHFWTGLTDSAYAAGMASRITRIVETIEAVAELISGGQGLAPEDGAEELAVAVEGQRGEELGGFGGRVGLGVQAGEHHPEDRGRRRASR